MKIIVLNTKGGVGKSTVSMQVIAPYLFWKNGKSDKINLIEFDDENSDSETFINSKIVDSKRYKLTGNDLDSTLINATLDNDNLVADIGGNKTTTYVLKSLSDTNLIDAFDCVVIPLTDGEQDSINAINVYEQIRNLSADIKVIFALSRVDRSMDLEIQFLDFFGDLKGRIDNREGYINRVAESDRNILKINNDESIKVSRAYGQTVFEICDLSLDDMKEKMKEALKEKDFEKSKKISYRITLVNKAKDFKEDTLKECFIKLDEVVA